MLLWLKMPSLVLVLIVFVPLTPPVLNAGEAPPEPGLSDSTVDWPLNGTANGKELRLYRPHVETLEGNRLTERAAFSLATDAQTQPVFGVVWITSRVTIDREDRTITMADQIATKVHLPGAADQEEAVVGKSVTGLVKGRDQVVSLDRILTALGDAERSRKSSEGLSVTPPKILVVPRRAVLLYVDGEPLGQPIDGTHFERIQNTPFLVVRDSAAGGYFLLYGRRWYSAPVITGPWIVQTQISNDVMALTPKLQGFPSDDAQPADSQPVDIVVSQVPAELISTDGPPAYEPIQGTNLLAVTNSDNDVFLDTTTQQHYVLLAGRWFRSGSLADGAAWEHVAPGGLPTSFSHIPPESPYGTVLAHVPGTSAAEEAVLDAQVPQTAAVKRDASIAVTYAGEPHWQTIPNTSLAYADNTASAVFKVADNDYYCCADGVWYHAAAANGPWIVATTVPPEIARLPPEHPLYYVRYVYVYDTTPDYVYVGYSPGYLGCYVFNGCVVWGTGYHYYRRYGGWYFPSPVTWGFCMAYNPWNGYWGGRTRLRFGGYYGGFGVVATRDGWWGPAGYRPVIVHQQLRSDGRDPVVGTPRRSEPRELPPPALSDNLYRRPGNRDRVLPASISRSSVRPAEPRRPGAPPTPRDSERIIPGRDGEVFRRHGDGWEQWQRDGWKALPRGNEPRGNEKNERPVSPPTTTPPERTPPQAVPPANQPPTPPANPGRPVSPPRNDPPRNDPPRNDPPTKPQPAQQPPTPQKPATPDSRPAPPRNDKPQQPAQQPPTAQRPPAPDPRPAPPRNDTPSKQPSAQEPPRPTLPRPQLDTPRPPPAPPVPPSRTEQLERQQQLEERGNQRAQQFQNYRAHPPEDLRRSSEKKSRSSEDKSRSHRKP